MFLKSLSIHNDEAVVRKINFHKGINLIIDETKSGKKTESGNSVGKTTVLRLIDFCLDGKGENIYIDPEFKTTNSKVESFLKDNNIVINLILTQDINDPKSSEIVIERNFRLRKEKIQKINGKTYPNEEFSQELKKRIFNYSEEKPTFKQLKSKNIRDEKNKLMNTLKVLNDFTTDVAYEMLFLFWLGIDTVGSKDKLVREKNIEEKLQSRLKKESNLSQIKQSLIVINKEIKELERRKQEFNLNDEYENDLSRLNDIKFEINKTSIKLSRLDLRKDLITESKAALEKDFANIDVAHIKSMYTKAKALIPNIQKTFEDTLHFHNEMIKQKIQFITEELPELEKEIIGIKNQLGLLLKQEKSLTVALNKTGAIEELQTIITELNSFYEKKGHFEEKKILWEASNNNLLEINKKLKKINTNISSKDDLIQERITDFNEYFSDISSRLDGLHSILSADNSEGVYKFKIGNIEGNPGTGSKKSQMASFDLAYIKFADEFEIPCLHFILQDQIENVHSNQISNLLNDIVDEVNCQYVLPVLRDKLPSNVDIDKLEVLSLSQDDKLFKI